MPGPFLRPTPDRRGESLGGLRFPTGVLKLALLDRRRWI